MAKKQSDIDKWLYSLPKSKQKGVARDSWKANSSANPQKRKSK